ncbi:hypothetical protein VNO78_29026 [Psophocarpus tetragonolobus]|uniref:Uncharacterized protein n=1 Tax=Psophocarpus tetragonolobus TaxID=3891 RepID=A0AAN9RUM6_PSOTE
MNIREEIEVSEESARAENRSFWRISSLVLKFQQVRLRSSGNVENLLDVVNLGTTNVLVNGLWDIKSTLEIPWDHGMISICIGSDSRKQPRAIPIHTLLKRIGVVQM